MRFAWIENDKVRDCCDGDPFLRYAPSVAALYRDVIPEHVQNGASLIDGQWVNQIIIPNIPVTKNDVLIKRIGQAHIRELMTLSERVRWDNDLSPTIKTVKIELAYERQWSDAQPVLELLRDAGDISQETFNAIEQSVI